MEARKTKWRRVEKSLTSALAALKAVAAELDDGILPELKAKSELEAIQKELVQCVRIEPHYSARDRT
jgi:hypothetical protein